MYVFKDLDTPNEPGGEAIRPDKHYSLNMA